MICPQCRASILAGSRFCSDCGAAVRKPPGDLMARPWPVTLLAAINFVAAGVCLVAVGLYLTLSDGSPAAHWVIAFALAWAGLSAPCGYGLLRLRPWARTLQLVKAWLALIAFPLGTLLSILILVYLLPRPSKVLFSGRRVEELTPEEIGLLQQPTVGAMALVIVGVGGAVAALFTVVIAAIAIPNLLSAIDRGKQKRTMADIRSVAAGVEAYAVDHDHYPLVCDFDELVPVLRPVYLRDMPRTDGWEQPLRYDCLKDEDEWIVGYGIHSAGKDGRFEFDGLEEYAGGATRDFDCDILFLDGEFYQYPDGLL